MSTFESDISIRAYTERPGRVPLGNIPPKPRLTASKWTLIFDCETSVDATQRLRVGFFQVRKLSQLERHGLFLDPDALSDFEQDAVRDYAESNGLEVLTITEFRTGVLLKFGYTRHATIVGFNLPFDISRIAISHGSARRDKRGGFSFLLSNNNEQPRIRVKHLSPKAAMIDFAKPAEQDTPRGMRNRDQNVDTYRGHFVDIKTLASALLSRRFSLRSLAETLETPTQKHETDEHGLITPQYLDYAQADVQVTWECYQALIRRYEKHGLAQSPSKILSEATIGKAYLQEMGIRPFLGCDPEHDRHDFGRILCAYYGGRAEVHFRREIQEVRYCDFKSMYPTVNALMGLWEVVIADGVLSENSTERTRAFLESVDLHDLRKPDTWRNLTTLVRIKPDYDLLPVRAKYDGRSNTIGLNYLTYEKPLWYTLADCIVSKLHTGKCPVLEEAVTYSAGKQQKDLNPIKILNRDEYAVNPNRDDFFTRLIDLRDEAKARNDDIQQTLKILANSTSYGIFIEVNRDDAPKAEKLNVFGPNSNCYENNSKAIEEPGRFFHPLLAVLITGAARLMLGIAEKLTLDNGLNWAFCDTDSLAITRPPKLSRKLFRQKTETVVNWFAALNPYEKPGSILQIEDVNYGISSKELEPLFCYAISSKRYALFNIGESGQPALRKASAHGLGHLVPPYPDTDDIPGLPKPQVPLPEIGVKRWQHDLWVRIIQAALTGHPDQVSLDWHPALGQPAAQRYTTSSPHMLAWLNTWNEGKPYDQQVKPFGFLLAYMPKTNLWADAPCLESSVVGSFGRGRPPKSHEPKPIAPYDSDPVKAVPTVFCRETGELLAKDRLKTYAEALAQYHLSSEGKFENGQFLDLGMTSRRHVVTTGVVLIGKEANRIGECGEADPISDACIEFRKTNIHDATVKKK